MKDLAEHVWCAGSTNLVQGFLAGLGVLGGGIALFPLETYVSRDRAGSAWSYARARRSLRAARALLYVLVPMGTATLVGYLLLYAASEGKSCDAQFTSTELDLVVLWSAGVALSFLILVALFILRVKVRHQSGDQRT